MLNPVPFLLTRMSCFKSVHSVLLRSHSFLEPLSQPIPIPVQAEPLLRHRVPSSPPSPGPSFSSIELQTLVDAREVEEPPCWELWKGTETESRSECPSLQVLRWPRIQERPAPTTGKDPDTQRESLLNYSIRTISPSRPANQLIGLNVSG